MATAKKAAKKAAAKKHHGLTLEQRMERLEQHADNVAEYLTQHGIHLPDPDTLHEQMEEKRGLAEDESAPDEF